VGRSAATDLWLDDAEVSRRHCSIATSGGNSLVRDLGSRNGTLVDGEPVQTAKLKADDEITIGCSVLRYAAEADAAAPCGEGGLTTLHPGESRFLSAKAGAPSARTQRDLKTLLRLSNILHSLRGIARIGFGEYDAAMEEKLEGLLLDMFGASSARVLSSDDENPVVRLACRRRAALLMDHPSERGRNVLAAPIVVRSDVPAAIYLESPRSGKPFDDDDLQFVGAVAEIAAVAWENASFVSWLHEENRRLDPASGNGDLGMLGTSSSFRELRQRIERVAVTDSSVLVLGESGTGKELVSQAIHMQSRRANGPFVAVNCASFAESLIDSEIFGHERGAFRPDLYFRLKVITLRTPPLRERPGDILPLAEHFAREFARRCGRCLIGVSAQARAYLQAHSWPGNVRELKHAIESAVVLGSGEMLLAEDLPEQIRAVTPPDLSDKPPPARRWLCNGL